jgi:hypothetical protein
VADEVLPDGDVVPVEGPDVAPPPVPAVEGDDVDPALGLTGATGAGSTGVTLTAALVGWVRGPLAAVARALA